MQYVHNMKITQYIKRENRDTLTSHQSLPSTPENAPSWYIYTHALPQPREKEYTLRVLQHCIHCNSVVKGIFHCQRRRPTHENTTLSPRGIQRGQLTATQGISMVLINLPVHLGERGERSISFQNSQRSEERAYTYSQRIVQYVVCINTASAQCSMYKYSQRIVQYV